MGDLSALKEHEIALNGVKFPIVGDVIERLIPRNPQKQLVGDPDFKTEQLLSNWITSDQRGGLLIEEMDESIHLDRFWWSTLDARFKNSLTLGPLSTLLTSPTDPAPSITDTGLELWDDVSNLTNYTFVQDTSTPTLTRNGADQEAGTFCAQITSGGGGSRSGHIYQDLSGYVNAWRGRKFTFTARCKDGNGAANLARVEIDDGVTVTTGSFHTGGGAYETLTVTAVLGVTATKLRVKCAMIAGNGETIFFDTLTIALVGTVGNPVQVAQFNSEVYWAFGKVLVKVNSAETGFDGVYTFTADITALISQLNDTMLIYLGDATNYWFMSTAEVFTETDVADATHGIIHDAKAWKIDSAGTISFAVTPNAASPSWTANGKLQIDDNDIQNLVEYFDANGNFIIHAGTKVGLWAHNTDDAEFIGTALRLPPHPNGGKGLTVFEDALFISQGLAARKYVSGNTPITLRMGLDLDDGLPELRSGEIVKFISGYNEIFALVDSTLEGSTSRSTVMAWDGIGWKLWWEATADNKNMYTGIVASANSLLLYFSTTDGVYKITLQRTTINPLKVSGYTFNSAGEHITPWFDAGTKSFKKLATKLTLFLSKMTANETVTVTYRIDKEATDLASEWTALGSAIVANGETILKFGTDSKGVVFHDIQLRFVSASGTNTLTPIINGITMSYDILGFSKAWDFTVSTSEATAEPKEIYDALQTIISTETLMTFTFRDGSVAADTHRVKVLPFTNPTPTGPNWDTTANLTVIEV